MVSPYGSPFEVQKYKKMLKSSPLYTYFIYLCTQKQT